MSHVCLSVHDFLHVTTYTNHLQYQSPHSVPNYPGWGLNGRYKNRKWGKKVNTCKSLNFGLVHSYIFYGQGFNILFLSTRKGESPCPCILILSANTSVAQCKNTANVMQDLGSNQAQMSLINENKNCWLSNYEITGTNSTITKRLQYFGPPEGKVQ